MAEKYFWLKLQKDFFKRHDIQIIEDMENGKDYILFYLKLLCESVSHNGNLRFSDTIPYNDKMLATITNTDIDKVRSAIKIFTELNMMEILQDGTIYLAECQKMLGSETKWAEYKRNSRMLDNVQRVSKDVQQEIDIEKDIDIDKKKDVKKEENIKTSSTTLKSLLSCFENITLDVEFEDDAYDIDKLIEKVKESSYLQSFNTLSAVLSKYDEIMQDKYKDFGIKRSAPKKSEQRTYSKDDMSNLFDDVSQIQI